MLFFKVLAVVWIDIYLLASVLLFSFNRSQYFEYEERHLYGWMHIALIVSIVALFTL
jgi:hypothetical protein